MNRNQFAACFLTIFYAGAQPVEPAHGIQAVYRIAGQTCGTYRESAAAENGGTRTSIETDLVLNRLGARLEMKSSTTYREAGGALQAVASDLSSSQQSTHTDVEAREGSLDIKIATGGKTYERSVPFAGTLLGPEAARRLLASRLHAAGDAVSYQTYSPELGAVVTIGATVVGVDDVAVDGRTVSGLKLEQTMTSMPGKTTTWIDREGWLIRQLVSGPFGDIEAVRSASTEISVASLPEELFGKSIVKANVRLPKERLIENIKLKIIHRRPELGWPDLETGNQQVLEKTPAFLVLRIARDAAAKFEGAGMEKYLAANALLQSDDANIERIAKDAAGNESDPWRAAQSLQRWTNDNMRFDAGIAIAPASEVARDRRGTCFGYAMLLGSLARAAGIPSRLRMGFVYAGGIWGGHAWVDVGIGERWIPLDGALYSPGAADAARFSFFTSALQEGTLAQAGSLGQMFGNVDIKIMEYTVDGHRVDVPEGAQPSTIAGNVYRNPWLGVSVEKPASFRFAGTDLAWPETTVVAMEGPAKQRVEIANLSASLPTGEFDGEKCLRDAGVAGARSGATIAGQRAVVVSSDQKAGAALVDQGNVWTIVATGPGSRALLDKVAASVVLEKVK